MHKRRSVNTGKTIHFILRLKKAFDSVPHRRLISKLEALGIRGSALNWFENYLYGRTHAVRIRETISPDRSVLSGVEVVKVLIIFVNNS